ncbi:hypothetical protein L2E82_43416 [Cichorium intybus]|uniref:Uncharacterized protein n=1 Tax=Cichorium intybus TaxID=13427 RepID=A0ACB8ZNH0_CICIN|nr:hypothetical protein L2E82_43416 [Cichorium intybus]
MLLGTPTSRDHSFRRRSSISSSQARIPRSSPRYVPGSFTDRNQSFAGEHSFTLLDPSHSRPTMFLDQANPVNSVRVPLSSSDQVLRTTPPVFPVTGPASFPFMFLLHRSNLPGITTTLPYPASR